MLDDFDQQMENYRKRKREAYVAIVVIILVTFACCLAIFFCTIHGRL